jgi:hypothetical protein
MPVIRLWHSKHNISVAAVMQTTTEELWKAVFSVGFHVGVISGEPNLTKRQLSREWYAASRQGYLAVARYS